MSSGEAEDALIDFLKECTLVEGAAVRIRCPTCNASVSLYCSSCCQIMVPREKWPKTITDGSIRVPFDIDIIVDDRRTASTGIHVPAILSSGGHDSKPVLTNNAAPRIRLFDREISDDIPDYDKERNTFLLFPGGNSLPISSVARTCTIERIVVLDCRWNHASGRMHPSVQKMQRVHLNCSLKQSYFWRWHNAGEGMISTVEAIYMCAWEVAKVLQWDSQERHKLVYLLWLFGLQREVIRRKYEQGGGISMPVHLPYSENGKEYQREKVRRNNKKAKVSVPTTSSSPIKLRRASTKARSP
jgi:hypothetical protein